MNPTRRKLAIATWSPPAEGNIYGKLVLDVSQAMIYVEHLRKKDGEKVTIAQSMSNLWTNPVRHEPNLHFGSGNSAALFVNALKVPTFWQASTQKLFNDI